MVDEDAAQPIPAPGESVQPVSEPTSAPTPPAEPATPPLETHPTVSEAATIEVPPAEPQTAQIPASEPLLSEPEPIATQTAAAEPTTSPTTTPSPAPTQNSNFARELLNKARAAIQSRKSKKLEKVLEFLNTKGKITNDEVEKLLHVSDATATRYLSELEKQGKIKQVGRTGKAVTYTKP